MSATDYQINDFADASICVPVKVAKRLKLRPGAILSADTFAAVREALGARREWPGG